MGIIFSHASSTVTVNKPNLLVALTKQLNALLNFCRILVQRNPFPKAQTPSHKIRVLNVTKDLNPVMLHTNTGFQITAMQ